MDHPNYWEELYETRDIQFALESVTTIIATSEQLKTPDWSEETRKAFRKLLNGGLDLLDEGNLQAETGDFLINAMISRIIFDIGLKLYPLNEGFVDKRDAAMALGTSALRDKKTMRNIVSKCIQATSGPEDDEAVVSALTSLKIRMALEGELAGFEAAEEAMRVMIGPVVEAVFIAWGDVIWHPIPQDPRDVEASERAWQAMLDFIVQNNARIEASSGLSNGHGQAAAGHV